MANKYKVSRPFIYEIKREFLELSEKPIYSKVGLTVLDEDRHLKELILSLRLECKSSINGISSFLSRFEQKCSSVGYVSSLLQDIGSKLPNVQPFTGDFIRVVLCSDEVFSKGQAILLTVEPLSLAILSIELSSNRQGESWEKHWIRLLEEGYEPILLCNDEGTGMAHGKQGLFPNLARQSDSFHAISHRLGLFKERFEKAAYGALDKLYDSERLANSSKSLATWHKRFADYEKKERLCHQAISLSDSFTFLYHCLLEQLQLFDNQGNLKNISQVLSDFETALAYLKDLGQVAINKEVNSIKSCQNELFTFRQNAQLIVTQLSEQVPLAVLKTLCLAWQAQRNSTNAKDIKRKNSLKRKEKYLLDSIETNQNKTTCDNYKELVYSKLAQIIQSSAAVECVNSILRPFLNAIKNQVTQEFLNLVMAYHNYRRFKQGKRKGKTPYEILTGNTQSCDWLNIILDKVA